MKKILLTAAGTGTAFSYATAIAKNFPGLEAFTADINEAEFVTASLFSKKHFVVPLSTDATYESAIKKIIEMEEIDFYLPLVDVEIKLAHQSDLLTSKLVANNIFFCNTCIEKDSYHSWASGLQIKTPQLLNADELNNEDTVVLKKNGGFGSKDTEIAKVVTMAKLDLTDFSFYEYINGEEYTIDCCPISSGVVTTVRKRVEVKNGVCVKAEVTKNDDLSNLALKLVNYFDLKQPFCFQVIKKNDDYYLIDLNPRLGAGTAMGEVTGKDYFSAHIALILNLDMHKFLIEKLHSCIVTRQYSNYLMKTL